uniref:Uncharacterized protein n=1 Tax=Siphoviridae sp. cteDy1 TaxID=2825587 RepID=A0A8S5V3V2_9CAUD|nr:MAG TPA: hypothetical protein [Siphoviridae sp. cteDy1]
MSNIIQKIYFNKFGYNFFVIGENIFRKIFNNLQI